MAGQPFKIAVPRVLWWFREWPFWRAFFEGLGFAVATNDPARPTAARHARTSTIVEEACFPMRLLIDRTAALAAEADAVFMPRLVSVDARGIMCPRFSGVPDILQLVLGSECRMLAPLIDAREGPPAVRRAYLDLACELGASRADAWCVYRSALGIQRRFEEELERRINLLPTADVFDMSKTPPAMPPNPPAFRLALLGHPYVVYDWEFNLGLIEKLKSLGAWIVPVESMPRRRIERCARRLEKNVYWTSGRDILGAALSLFERGGVEGVAHLACFKCGVDGLLGEIVRAAARGRRETGFLSLVLDGHDNELGLMTRLEAFMDIVRRRK